MNRFQDEYPGEIPEDLDVAPNECRGRAPSPNADGEGGSELLRKEKVTVKVGRTRGARVGASLVGALLAPLVCTGCGLDDGDKTPNDAVLVGAALPFTGTRATIGRNLEQALQLAVEDVNEAGGVDGRPLHLVVQDSNSGSERGLNGLLTLLYEDEVRYLIGPEEGSLADEIVPDVKGLDVLNVLPGYASPGIERVGQSGAWLRLPPTPVALGCGVSELALKYGMTSVASITTRDDFNQNIASQFATEYFDNGGAISTVTVPSGNQSYVDITSEAFDAEADRTLLLADPSTAATIVAEWAVRAQTVNWLLGPTLHTPGFLLNVPPGSLDGAYGVSPTLSLKSECEEKDVAYQGSISCAQNNASAFSEHFAKRWNGEQPFPAAHFYYDAIVLVALGLQYAAARGDSELSARQLHSLILEMTNEAEELGRWSNLGAAFGKAAEGRRIGYVGAAAEYEFDKYGAAEYAIFDAWRVAGLNYVLQGTLHTRCTDDRWIGSGGSNRDQSGGSDAGD